MYISISRSVNPEETLPLNGCSSITQSGPTGVQFDLTPADLRSLKLNRGLGTDAFNSFITIGSGSGLLEAGTNDQIQPFGANSAVQVSNYVPDTTRPEVIVDGFDAFDLDSGRFIITFDEPVDTLSIAVPGTLFFQRHVEVTLTEDSFEVQAIDCQPPECVDGETVIFLLPREVLNQLKLAPRVCNSAATCWLTILDPGSFIRDMAGNQVVPLPNGLRSDSRYLGAFIEDTTGPILESFLLDMTSRQLLLTFDEPVEASSFQVAGISIQSMPGVSDPSLCYQITDGIIPSGNGVQIVVDLSDADINALQSRPNVATTLSNTFLSMTTETAIDLSFQQNEAQEIPKASAQAATGYVPDTAPPVIRDFDLNFDLNTLALLFSEPVLVSTVNLDRLILLSSSSSGAVNYRLNGGDILETELDASAVIAFVLTNEDQTFLEVSQEIATGSNNTFLASLPGLADDSNGLSSSELPSASALAVRSFTPDTSSPRLAGFTLDMDSGELVVSFDDVIRASTFDVSAITLQSANERVPLEWHTLSQTSSTNSMENGFEITVFIGDGDLNRIKQISNLATSIDHTYLTATATIADDVNLMDTIAVTDGNSLQASSFTSDITRPTLSSWTLDVNARQIILTYSETVDITSFMPSQFQVQTSASSSSSDRYALTGYEDLIPPDADFRFVVQLNEIDANLIKFRTDLGTEQSNSFLTISASAIEDTSANPVVAIENGQGLQTSAFVEDITGPNLRSFSLNVNTGLLQLTFDETVNAATFNISAFTLLNRASRFSSAYTLESSSASTINNNQIDVDLSRSDLDAIKAVSNLATSASDTFIVASQYAVEDMNANRLSEISQDAALQVSIYSEDLTSPELDSFSLNLSLEQLILTFSETVRATSLDPTQMTLQSHINAGTTGSTLITLSGGIISQTDSPIIRLQLSEEDANSIKQFRSIATSPSNTYLSLSSAAVQDPAGNTVRAVASNNALQVGEFIEDSVAPLLVSFALDLDQRVLSLTFDETIDFSRFSITSVALQDDATDPIQTVALGALSTTNTTANSPVFFVWLSDDDFNAISSSFPLATMDVNTFITLEAGTVEDTNGNPSIAIPSNAALQITSHTADTTRPSLDNFDFDLNLGVLTLVFSESVNVSCFDLTQLTLQSSSSAPVYTHTLTGGLVSQPESTTTINVELLRSDLNTIKELTGLASLRSSTFLSITSETVKDMNRNYVFPIPMSNALLVREFVEDTSGAVVESFDLDYDDGILTLYFDETVNLATFEPTIVTLLLNGDSISYTLRDSTVLDTGLQVLSRVQLSDGDLNELKRLRICSTFDSCFVALTDALVEDVSGNQNVIIDASFPLSLSNYFPDLTRPQLVSFPEFDLNAGTFTLEFTETVDVSVLDISELQLHDSYANATYTFEFEELNPISGDNTIITLQLGLNDLNRLKLNTAFCTFDGNCWVRFSSFFLSDVVGNPIIPVAANTIASFHQPAVFVPDTTPPILTSFTIDLDAGRMTFTFDEVVRLATFIPMNLTFQNSPLASIELNLRENGMAYRSADGLVINWSMAIPDLNLLKSVEELFTSVSYSYLTYDYLVEDVSGNGISRRVDGENALLSAEFVPDTTRPRLEAFSAFNLDNWTLTLQFDEPVNLSSVRLEEIAIAANSTLDLSIYDPIRINDWYSLYFENGTIYNLTHVFYPGEYILSCPFSLRPTPEPPTTASAATPQATTDPALMGGVFSSGSGSASASGSGMLSPDVGGEMDDNLTRAMEDMLSSSEDEFYPLLLRGCTIYRNLSVQEPFWFLTGGELSYVDERKQQVMLLFNRVDIRMLKISELFASNESDTWIAYNATALDDLARNPVIPTSLFNATRLQDGAFVNDVTPPIFEFISLDLDRNTLSLHYSDVIDIQSVNPLLIEISESPGSNNSYFLQGPYPYPIPLTVDTRDDFVLEIPLSFVDRNFIKSNLDLGTSETNTFVSFPRMIATDIYGRYPMGNGASFVQTAVFIPDTTGPILVDFSLDFDTGILKLTFDEVVDPNTVQTEQITLQNIQNVTVSGIETFIAHTLIEGSPVANNTAVYILELQLDLDLNALKISPNLTNDVNDSFISVSIGAVLDTSGNPSQPSTEDDAIQASEVIIDTSPPSLRYFDLNLNENLLILKFSEAIVADTLNITGITLQSGPNFTTGVDYQVFSPSSVTFLQEFESLVFIRFTMADEDELKDTSRLLALSPETTYLAIESSTAEDYVGFNVVSVPRDSAVPVRQYFEGAYKFMSS